MGKWEDVLIMQQEGDSAFIEQQYDVSAERYREALQLLSDMEISIPDVLKNALESGQSSILNGNKDDAIASFEIALAIDGNNLDAKQGLDRALKLDQVLARTQRGKTEFELGSYKLAIELFQDALSIDPNWEPAINGLNQAKKSYADNLFLESLSKGYRSLNDESFDDAKILFEQALSVRPNSKEALQALDELNLKRIASLTKSLKYKGLIAEVNEEWNQAKGFTKKFWSLTPILKKSKRVSIGLNQEFYWMQK